MILARFTDGDVDDQELPEFQTNVTILPGPVIVWALACHSETRWSEFYEVRVMEVVICRCLVVIHVP